GTEGAGGCLAKDGAEPARVHGIEAHTGSLRPGRLADIVLWRPGYFGVRPEIVLKGGWFAWGPFGSGNATVEGAEPRRYGAHWSGQGTAAPELSVTFLSAAAAAAAAGAGGPGRRKRRGSGRGLVPVRATGEVTGASLLANTMVPPVEVDPADGTVHLGGRALRADPLTDVPLSRRYLLG